jgi:hypothetical protein
MCAKTQRKLLVKFNVEFKAKRYLRREKKKIDDFALFPIWRRAKFVRFPYANAHSFIFSNFKLSFINQKSYTVFQNKKIILLSCH